MAKNPPKGPGRRGAVTNRSQFRGPNGHWTKREVCERGGDVVVAWLVGPARPRGTPL